MIVAQMSEVPPKMQSASVGEVAGGGVRAGGEGRHSVHSQFRRCGGDEDK